MFERKLQVAAWLHAIDVLVVGPGLGRNPFVMETARALIRLAMEKIVVVIDGDGLFALQQASGKADFCFAGVLIFSKDDGLLLALPETVVLTPNVGEAERLDRQLLGRHLRALVLRKVGAPYPFVFVSSFLFLRVGCSGQDWDGARVRH